MTARVKMAIVIRPINIETEIRAVENLQKTIWGFPDMEVVPLTQLVAAIHSGGALLGAFDGEELAGFAYGFASFIDGKPGHHSHMLAVKSEYRNHHLGEKLKLAQRDFVLKQGLNEMSWTFDPLQSLNAYFNFNKLGVVSDQYIADFYGKDATSFLHHTGTDRLWVTWHLDSARVVERIENKASSFDFEGVKKLLELTEGEIPSATSISENLTERHLAIELPANINELQKRDADLANIWREATRTAFLTALKQGYYVKDFYRLTREGQNFGAYLLERAA